MIRVGKIKELLRQAEKLSLHAPAMELAEQLCLELNIPPPEYYALCDDRYLNDESHPGTIAAYKQLQKFAEQKSPPPENGKPLSKEAATVLKKITGKK